MKRDPFKIRNSTNWPPKKKASPAARKPVATVSSISDFHAWRLKGIGGSDAPAVMDTSPWSNPQKLIEIKAGIREPDPLNYPMIRGLRLEQHARKKYEEITQTEMPKGREIDPRYDFLRVNIDGLNLNVGRASEFKCPGKVDHSTAVAGEIPYHYVFQLVHTLMILYQRYGIDVMDYFSFYKSRAGEVHTATVPFKRDRKLENKLFPKEVELWERKLELERKIQMDKPNGQRKPANGVAFTKQEASEILQLAREIGCVRLKLPGFEADFAPQGNNEIRENSNRARLPNCEDCGEEKILGTYGIYCRPCYIEKKENNKWNQKKRW